MSDTVAAAPVAEEKEPSGVISKKRFSEEMQHVIFEEIGQKISKEAAWSLFKKIFEKTVNLACEMPVSLAGIGKFEVQKMKPRKSKVGVVPFVPRFKLRSSSSISRYLEDRFNVSLPKKEPSATPAAEKPKSEFNF